MKCTRCQRRAAAIRSLGVERVRVAAAIGTFRITKYSGAVEVADLCEQDVRAMRSSGFKVEAVEG